MDNITQSTSAQKRLPKHVSLDSGRAAFRITELVKLLPLSRTTITNMVDDGRIRSSRLGAVRVIPREEVERILREGC